MEPHPELPRPYRQGEPPPARDTSDQRRWVVSKDTNPRIRMAYEPEAAQAFVASNPGWSAIAEDDPRWLPYRPGLASRRRRSTAETSTTMGAPAAQRD